jgi:hypothetical protein
MRYYLACVAVGVTLAASSATPGKAQIVQDLPAVGSPLAAYPGFGHNKDADEAQYLREDLQRQQMIARCMTAAGHPYVPVAPARNPQKAANLASRDPPPRDPNDVHAMSLPLQGREAYYLALYGVRNPNAREGPLWDPRSATGGGCWGDALRAIRGVYAAASELVEPYIAMRRSVLRDARVTAAAQRWSECMRGRGFAYTSPQHLAAAADSAAIARPRDADTQQRFHQAIEPGRLCAGESGLNEAIAQSRADREAAFVATYKTQLDRHLERLRTQPPAPDE